MNINIYLSIYLIINSIIMAFIALYSLMLKKITYNKIFTLLCFSTAIYSFGYSMELFCTSIDKILFWNYIEYIGLPLIPAFWLVFSIQYCEKDKMLSYKTYSLIFLIPVITIILRYTNNFHHLFYANVKLYNNGMFNLINIQKGPWYYVNFLYDCLAEVVSGILYWQLFFRSNARIRSQAILMFIASVFPWISVILITLYKTPSGIDIGPFTISISTVVFLVGFFRYNFLYLRPIARDKVFEWSNDGIIILDNNYIIIDFNAIASKILTNLKSNSIGDKFDDYIIDYKVIKSSIENSSESQIKIENGGSNYYSVKSMKILNSRNSIIGYLIFLHDITAYINTMDKLNYLACIDELTGVYNRRYFAERSQNELLRAKRYNHPLSFIILDIDLFKNINDNYGHLAGDEVLKEIGMICKETTRSMDLVGRFGGEEFMILLPETGVEEAEVIAGRLLKKIEKSETVYSGNIIKVTASFGVTGTSLVDNLDLNTLFKYADKALYNAKDDGRNCVRSSCL